MKTIKKVGLIFLSLLFATSCVSSRKYADAVNEQKKMKEQASSLEAKNQTLQSDNGKLQQQLTELKQLLDQKQKDFDSNKAQLAKEQSILNDLRKALQMEQSEIGSIKQEVCSALKCFAPDELSVKEKDGELYVSMYDKLLFPTGSTVVNKRGKEALKMLSDVLRKNNMMIMVEGHTDSIPIHNTKFRDNWDLSVLRSTSVIRVLINDKVAPSRIIASGKGKYHPFDTNRTENGRKLNRRTDIVLVPRLEQLYSLLNQGNKLDLAPLLSKISLL